MFSTRRTVTTMLTVFLVTATQLYAQDYSILDNVKVQLVSENNLASSSLRPAPPTQVQEGTIAGQVTAASTSQPLVGAQVLIPGTSFGTLTDNSGSYRLINVPAGTVTVRVQLIGYTTAERMIAVTADQTTVVNFALEESAIELQGIVVTALGISRQERSIGYATTDLEGAEISQIPTDNISSNLAGKVAGLEIKNLGTLGGSSSVVLRGYSSISGSNQALFIVDGIPVNNSSNAECNIGCAGNLSANFLGRSGVDYGNAIQDLNPADIESITVLKGANAAALYGARAANGVILVTTKKGAGADGFEMSGSTGLTWKTPLRMPTFQNKYGGGYVPTGYNWVNGAGAGLNDAVDESWGPRLDGTEYMQWWSPEPQPFLASPYSPRKFYQTGHNSTTNIAISAAGDGKHIRFSTTYMNASGLVPSSQLERTTYFLAGGLDATEDISVTASASYIKTHGEDRPVFRGFPGGIGVLFSYWQRQIDIGRLRDAYRHWQRTGEAPRPGHPDDRIPNWNHNFFDNLFYTTYERDQYDTRDRLIGSIKVDYRINDWLSVMSRLGTDWSSHGRFETFPGYSLAHPEGEYLANRISRQEQNADLLITGNFGITEALRLTVRGGGTIRRSHVDHTFTRLPALNVPQIYNVSNSAGPPISTEFIGRKHVNSVYGLATLSYRNFAFLDVTGRNDWTSTLPENHHSYFYPSISGSFIVTDLFELPEFFDYLKLRTSWARVGSSAEPYQLRTVFEQGTFWQGTPSFTSPARLKNPNLRPEQTVSIEFGTEVRFAGGRGTLDLTYYTMNTSDQIVPVPISHTTGYTHAVLNAGEVENKGIEALLELDIMRDVAGLNWTLTTNFAKNENRVVSLPRGLESIVLGTTRGLTVEARVGEEYGVLVGQVTKKNDQGQYIVGFNGRPVFTDTRQVLGHFPPDWTAGIRNSFNYQDVTLSFLFDVRKGGSIFCQTCAIRRRTGQLIETLKSRDDFEIVHAGVNPDGTPNDIGLPLPNYWRARYDSYGHFTYDASFVKLREATLSFDVPENMMSYLPFSSARVSIVGRNLLLFTDVPHIDPEIAATSGNAKGMEIFAKPSARSFGFNIRFRL